MRKEESEASAKYNIVVPDYFIALNVGGKLVKIKAG